LERSDIYNRLIEEFKKYATGGTPDYQETFLKILVCPSNMPSDTAGRNPWLAYRVNTGRNRANPKVMPGASQADQARAKIVQSQITSEGVFTDQAAVPRTYTAYQGEQVIRVSLSYISAKDGSSTTLLLSEMSNSDTQLSDWKIPDSGIEDDELKYPQTLGFNWKGLDKDNLNPASVVTPYTPADQMKSNHPSGVVISFCDGHQTFLKTDIEAMIFMQLMAPNDRGAGDVESYTATPVVGGIRNANNTANQAPPLDEGAY
jgi:hypothetical protein